MIVSVLLYPYFGMAQPKCSVTRIEFPEFLFGHIDAAPDSVPFLKVITKNEDFHHAETDTRQSWPMSLVGAGNAAHRPE